MESWPQRTLVKLSIIGYKKTYGSKRKRWMKLPEIDHLASEIIPDSFNSRDAWPNLNLLKRLETNLTVEAAGHLEQLRLCQTEYVSLLKKQSKLEYRLNIYLLVVVQHVVTGAMEVIQLKLGDITLPLD